MKDNEEEWVRITIGDHGLGIPEEIEPYIFEPFFITKDRSGNPGLGNAISYGNRMNHKGRLTFKTEENKGPEFYVMYTNLSTLFL